MSNPKKPPTAETSSMAGAETQTSAGMPGQDVDPALLPTAARISGSGQDDVDPRPAPLVEDGGVKRYDPRRTLGAGGMGEVLLCKDQRIGREVAMKLMHPEHAHSVSTRSRFEREARVQGQLEHPAIVPVYDLGQTEQGEAFFTMKRVRGRTLREVLDQLAAGDEEVNRRFSRRRLLSAFSNVCLAVDFAHARGVLHRDIKPDNVMLGDYGEVYLLDWGVARVLSASAAEHSDAGASREPVAEDPAPERVDSDAPTGARTVHGSVLGTPGYMSPEQARGALDRLGPATDVYALGAVLFEILAGERLHAGRSVSDLLLSVMEGRVEARPSLRAPQRQVPPELDSICARATVTDPSQRLLSARALSEAIERFLDGDRDVTLRRETAAKYAESAAAAAQAALGADDLPARRRASAEASRALAFDPENRSALKVLLDMLTSPPRTTPPEARASLERAQVEQSRELSRQGAITLGAYIPLLFLAFFFPVLDWKVVATMAVTLVTAFVLMWAAIRADRTDTPLISAALGFLLVATLLAARVAGPFIMLPGLLLANLMGFGLFPGRRRRIAFFVASVLAVPLLFAIDRSGLVPSACVFTADGLHVIPRLLAFDPRSFAVLLLVATVMPMLAGGAVVNRMLERAARNETAMHVTAWQLRQMLPERTEASGGG